jgi:hypothetical protein
MSDIKERNKIAFEAMKARFQETLKEDIEMPLGDLVEFAHAVEEFTNYRDVGKNSQLTCFLLQDIGYGYPDAPVIPRYKTFKTLGIGDSLNDWDNRYEMGK